MPPSHLDGGSADAGECRHLRSSPREEYRMFPRIGALRPQSHPLLVASGIVMATALGLVPLAASALPVGAQAGNRTVASAASKKATASESGTSRAASSTVRTASLASLGPLETIA